MAKKKEVSKAEEILPKKDKVEQTPIKEPVKAFLSNERVLTENSDNAKELYNQSRYGNLLEDGRVQLALIESLYLVEKKRLFVYDGKNKEIGFDALLKKSQKVEPNSG